jgi:hypothetical protein
MKKILIYRNELLPTSETFIKAQAGAIHAFFVKLAGLKHVMNGLPVPEGSIFLTRDNTFLSILQRYLFMNFGFGPAFLKALRAEKPDLVHCHFATDGAVAMYIAEALGVPLICISENAGAKIVHSAPRERCVAAEQK